MFVTEMCNTKRVSAAVQGDMKWRVQAKVEMYSKYERQKDKRSYDERLTLFTGPQYTYPAERIKPSKVLRWSEEGLPIYGDAGQAEEEPAAPAEQPAVDGVAA